MFNLFGKKKPSVTVKDLIWITEGAKLEAILNEYKKNNEPVIAAWFDATYKKLELLFSNAGFSSDTIFMTRELASHHVINHPLIFAEHYPLANKEEALFEKLGLSEVRIYSSLDEPLLIYFDGEKLSGMVKSLGMKEDEPLEHKLISSSIKNAQEKIADKVVVEQSANSSSDWFLFNLGKTQL